MTPTEILAPFPRGAELRAQLDGGCTSVHALIESMEVIEILPDGRWWFLFRQVGLHARLWLISAPRIVDDSFEFTTEWGARYYVGPIIENWAEERLAGWWKELPADADAIRACHREAARDEIADRNATNRR